MQLETRQEGKVFIVTVIEKRLDASTAWKFKDALLRLIRAGNFLIVLDLAGVDFVDSAGFGAIISCLKQIGKDGNIAIAGANEHILSVFHLTRMDRIFLVRRTTAEAVQALAA